MSVNRFRLEKKLARSRMKGILGGVDREHRAAWSLTILEIVLSHSRWERSELILAYLPMPAEVDTTPIVEAALSAGKSVGVPRMYGAEIRFHKIPDLAGPWDFHPYGLREPPIDLPVIDPCSMKGGEVFVVTPGLCFDTGGKRLGFGKGYYDKFITRCREDSKADFFFAGICFAVQLVSGVPAEDHDCVLDAVITERGVEYTRPATPPSA